MITSVGKSLVMRWETGTSKSMVSTLLQATPIGLVDQETVDGQVKGFVTPTPRDGVP